MISIIMSENLRPSQPLYENRPEYGPCHEEGVKRATDMIDDLFASGLHGFGQLKESSFDREGTSISWSLSYIDQRTLTQEIFMPASRLSLSYTREKGSPSTEIYRVHISHPTSADKPNIRLASMYTITYYGRDQASFDATAESNNPLRLEEALPDPRKMTVFDNYALIDELYAVDSLKPIDNQD